MNTAYVIALTVLCVMAVEQVWYTIARRQRGLHRCTPTLFTTMLWRIFKDRRRRRRLEREQSARTHTTSTATCPLHVTATDADAPPWRRFPWVRWM